MGRFQKRRGPSGQKNRDIENTWWVYGLFGLSVMAYLLAAWIPAREVAPLKEEMVLASRIMAEASSAVRECREERSLRIDLSADINRTGWIGERLSGITSSLGSVEAKRTTANPNFAGLLVLLLRHAGVRKGDAVAVCASGSFPALVAATLSAASVIEVEPLVLLSLGASQWGANIPGFHILRIHRCLRSRGIFRWTPVAVSLGGEKDAGGGMEDRARHRLLREIAASGIPFLDETLLEPAVEARLQLLERSAGSKRISAFVNIGGSWSSLGQDPRVLEIPPGLVTIEDFPPKPDQGLIYAMAARGIPVIHLLYIRGLAKKYGLEWDPVPLPEPGEGALYRNLRTERCSFFLIAGVYLGLVGLVGVILSRRPIGFV